MRVPGSTEHLVALLVLISACGGDDAANAEDRSVDEADRVDGSAETDTGNDSLSTERDAEEDCAAYAGPETMGNLPAVITEASGIAVSWADPEVLWLHNDSGGSAEIYAVRSTGDLLATVAIENAQFRDWEDISGGPCRPGDPDRSCLYIGDIGDNATSAEQISIYRIPEPDFSAGDAVAYAEVMNVVYGDGPRDCEALVVDEQADIYLLTKEWAGDGTFRVYRVPFVSSEETQTAEFVSEHEVTGFPSELFQVVTGADYRPDLGRLMVRLYTVALEYRLPAGAGLEQLAAAERFEVPVGREGQGEAIAYGTAGYWHVSEGNEPPIWFVSCE
jgi:hypothetical protein